MAIKCFDADGIHYISDKGHRGNVNSLKNLMAPFGSEERPFEEISKRAHSEEANRKRSETLKKKHAAKKEAKYVAEVTEGVMKRISNKKLTKTQIQNLDINDWLTEEEKDNLTYRQALNARAAILGLIEPDTSKAIKAMEYVRDSAGEKPADKTDISIMAEKSKESTLLIDALMNEEDEFEDEWDDE